MADTEKCENACFIAVVIFVVATSLAAIGYIGSQSLHYSTFSPPTEDSWRDFYREHSTPEYTPERLRQ